MKKMAMSNVLIVGMKGLGVEIGESCHRCRDFWILTDPTRLAKNVALAGVKSVTIYDPDPVEIADLGTQVSQFEGSCQLYRTAAKAD